MNLSDESKAALRKALETSANALSEAIDASGKLVKGNVKELAHEVIVYEGFISSAFEMLGSLVLFLLLSIGSWYCYHTKDDVKVIGFVLLAAGYLAFVLWFLDSAKRMLMAKFAPRLFLIEYAAYLLKK